jgi:hypothetical protein
MEQYERTSRKTCPSATLSTTNHTWTDPGLCGGRLGTNCLNHSMATHLYDSSPNTNPHKKFLNKVFWTISRVRHFFLHTFEIAQ